MNPEVMILHWPMYHFPEANQMPILNACHEHVNGRGLFIPQATEHRQRPRTVFFTPGSVVQAKTADVIWKIDPHNKQLYRTYSESISRQ